MLVVSHNAQSFDAQEEIEHFESVMPITVRHVALSLVPKSGNGVHGMLLDAITPEIETDYLLTLDSDCLPIAYGWLDLLLGLMSEETVCTGILHPWAPPPNDLPEYLIEYRVRSQHCWNLTHVACQMVRTDFLAALRAMGVTYSSGDDTGLLIPQWAHQLGMGVGGLKPTRCPAPSGNHDPEFNRYTCLVYGDMICHIGGFTRQVALHDKSVLEKEYGWAIQRILKGHSASFLLNDKFSYRFKFDKEEEVAKEKMNRLFGMRDE